MGKLIDDLHTTSEKISTAGASGAVIDTLPLWETIPPRPGYELRYCAETQEVVLRDIASGLFIQMPEARAVSDDLNVAYEFLARAIEHKGDRVDKPVPPGMQSRLSGLV